MYITTLNSETALRDFLNYYFKKLRVGVIMCIEGSSHLKFGVGKSYTAIRIGELLDRDFRKGTEGMKKIVFDEQDFVRAMEALEEKERIYGQVVIVDEAGILVDAKRWYSFINKRIRDAIFTIREKRALVIFVTPFIGAIDKSIRFCVSLLGVCDKIVEAGMMPEVRFRLYRLHWDETQVKFYKYKVAMYNKEKNCPTVFNYFRVRFPQNKELIEEYEKKQHEFKKLVRFGKKETTKEKILKIEEEILKNQDLIFVDKRGKKKVYMEDIMHFYNVPATMARVIYRRVNRRLNNGN